MTDSDSELVRVRSSVVDAHRAEHADPADIQRAYLRFSWARRKAPARLPGLRWLVAGVAIGLGVASAATLVPKLGIRPAMPSESPKVSVAIATQQPARGRARSSGVKEEPALEEPALEEALPVSSAQPPAALRLPSAVAAPNVAAQRSPAPAKAELSTSASDWQRAAGALRDGDLAAAEAALAKLEKSDSALDRQAAELARAQLLVRRGRGAEAKSTLQRLAHEGGSEVIRSQAASTLQTLGD